MKTPRSPASRSRPKSTLLGAPVSASGESSAKRVTSRSRVLNAEALEQLGATRLAGLLMGAAEDDPALARSLRLALAGTESSSRLAAELEKRLRTIQRSKGYVEWDKVRPLGRELESLRSMITGPLAAADPAAAAGQMRLLLSLGESVLERSDDGSGALGEVFRDAGADLGRLWGLLPQDPISLAGTLLSVLDADGYGVTDRLLAATGPALGIEGRAELRRLLQARLRKPPTPRAAGSHRGDSYERFTTSLLLRELADLEGDVDAYIVAVEAAGRVENLACDIADRLIRHDRPAEALAWLERGSARHAEIRHVDLRIAALDGLGRTQESQDLRLTSFQTWLSADHLRGYLRGLPDFEDVEAEDRAIAHALSHPDRNLALSFLIGWPNLRAANQLVRICGAELDARDYGRLQPAAESLAENYPTAATLLHRNLAEDVLRRASSRQYRYAVRDVRASAALAAFLEPDAGLETHDDFLARLRREHPRKSGFWMLLAPEPR